MRRTDIDLWAIDEVHFQQYGSRCMMWVPPEEKDPVLLHEPTRKSVGYFGAIRLRDGVLFYSREEAQFNGQTFFNFMKQLKKKYARKGRKIILITDNARYHHARIHEGWREEHSKKFALEFLPAYSPDLNPIERLWKYTRRLCLHNQYFDSLEKVISKIENQFDMWPKGNESTRKLCAII